MDGGDEGSLIASGAMTSVDITLEDVVALMADGSAVLQVGATLIMQSDGVSTACSSRTGFKDADRGIDRVMLVGVGGRASSP